MLKINNTASYEPKNNSEIRNWIKAVNGRDHSTYAFTTYERFLITMDYFKYDFSAFEFVIHAYIKTELMHEAGSCAFENSIVKLILDDLTKLEKSKRPVVRLMVNRVDVLATNSIILKTYSELTFRFSDPPDSLYSSWLAATLSECKVKIITLDCTEPGFIERVLAAPRLRNFNLNLMNHGHYEYVFRLENNYTLLDLNCETPEVKQILNRNNELRWTIIRSVIQFLAIKKFNRSEDLLFKVDRNVILKIADLALESLYDKQILKALKDKLPNIN